MSPNRAGWGPGCLWLPAEMEQPRSTGGVGSGRHPSRSGGPLVRLQGPRGLWLAKPLRERRQSRHTALLSGGHRLPRVPSAPLPCAPGCPPPGLHELSRGRVGRPRAAPERGGRAGSSSLRPVPRDRGVGAGAHPGAPRGGCPGLTILCTRWGAGLVAPSLGQPLCWERAWWRPPRLHLILCRREWRVGSGAEGPGPRQARVRRGQPQGGREGVTGCRREAGG